MRKPKVKAEAKINIAQLRRELMKEVDRINREQVAE